MAKQRTRKFVTKILRKTCSSSVNSISERDINFKQNKYNKLQKISAKNKCFFRQKISSNMGSSIVQLQYLCQTKFTYLLNYK